MAHIGAVCDPSPTHVIGMSRIGRELQRRGHRFTLFHTSAIANLVEKQKVPFWPLPDNAFMREYLLKAGLQSKLSLRLAQEYGMESIRLICENAPAAFRAAQIDFLLADQGEPAAGSVAEFMGIPFATICIALPYNSEPAIPPFFLPWSYRDTVAGRMRNRLAYTARDFAVRPVRMALDRYRKRWKLLHVPDLDRTFSTLAQISQLIEELDFPRKNLPACFRYAGPFRGERAEPVAFDYGCLDGRPLVYSSMGTILSGSDGLWQAIAAACAEEGVQLVLSLGKTPRTSVFDALGGKPVVVNYAPQTELLKLAQAVITHAGINTVLESLSEGVPIVALPITADQPGIAARVAYHGAGIHLSASQRTQSDIRDALHRVLHQPEYRKRATGLQGLLAASRGVVMAADLIERVLAPNRVSQRGTV